MLDVCISRRFREKNKADGYTQMQVKYEIKTCILGYFEIDFKHG